MLTVLVLVFEQYVTYNSSVNTYIFFAVSVTAIYHQVALGLNHPYSISENSKFDIYH